MFKKFIGLVLLSVGLVACGSEQGSVPEVEENTASVSKNVKAQASNCRRVRFNGNLHVTDDDWGRDYKNNYPIKDHVILCRSDIQRPFSVIREHGNEMRVEFHATVSWANYKDPNDTTIQIKGRVLMYEGTSPRTNDLDATGYFGWHPDIIIPHRETKTAKGYIESDEWNDDSSVSYFAHIHNDQVY